jgi:hypothetical protein
MRVGFAVGLVALVMYVVVGCGASQPAAAPKKDACADFELDVEKFWSAGVKADFMGYGGAVEASERQKVATKLDQLSDDWVRLRTATCRDHFDRNLIDAGEYTRRVKCFDERLDQQRKLVTLMKGNDTAGADKLAAALAETPDACK